MIDNSNLTVMVAGGAGFVGSAIIRELLKLNAKVVCFDNYLHGIPENVEGLDNVEVVQGDALNQLEIIDAITRCDVKYIINCIGDTYVPTAYKWPRRFFDINLTACLNILEACKICDVKRMLYVSSTEVYGITEEETLDEYVSLKPVNTYAVSKLAADRLCYTYCIEHDVPVVTARIFNCYGPRESEPYIIPEIIHQLNKGNVLRLGNIKAERDFTYVHDTARALIKVLFSNMENGDVVNVGSNTSFSVEWLANQIADIMNVKDLKIEVDTDRLRACDIDRFRCDNTKLKSITDWQPEIDMIEGLKMTVDWFYKNDCKWSWESFVKNSNILK
ncbi:GDP-mannose 4,6-dehydratase [Fulvivirga sp. 29W222]|uniref:GDP-mannose 4,6-dehydratase n=1 Tax=Fulvivirga marina TaxID=2494733 RepID=A0A937FW89_9BACT|nr:NAD(P)-dependent oxidoreductase [Fulvivirga marina]MBL6445767.1 GDP-mannose 4,6-dehydratase [Fulvivirga marina]